MVLELALLFAAGAYYPPSAHDAERAVAAELPGGSASAVSVRLQRCAPQASYEIQGPFGLIVLDAGHECVLTISTAARPDYQARGFFHHDGLGWRYYGPTGEPIVAETQSHGVGGGYSEQTPKPGSILYSGDAGPDLADPYKRILAGHDWLFGPDD